MKLTACLGLALLPVLGTGCLDQTAASAAAASPSTPAATAAPAAGPQAVQEESVIRGYDPAAPGATIQALAQGGLRASKLAFEKKAIELGEIYQFENHPFEFPFTVEGADPVIITRVDSSCGCTDARIRADWQMNAPGADPAVEILYVYGREIPAGARATVIGTFTPERRIGDKATNLTLYGNFSNSPARLDLHTTIRALFDIQPRQVRFGDVLAGVANNAAPQDIKVVCRSPFEVVQWRRLPVGIKVEPVGQPKATGYKDEVERHFRITLGPDAPEGTLSTSCIAETSIKMDLEIMVLANVIGPVSYTPPARLAFGMVPIGEERTRTIDIESSLDTVVLPAPIVQLEGDLIQFMTATVSTIEAGRFHRVQLTLPAMDRAKPFSGVLRLQYPEGSGIQTREFQVSGRVTATGPTKDPK